MKRISRTIAVLSLLAASLFLTRFAHAQPEGPVISVVTGGFGSFTKESWITEYGVIGVSALFVTGERTSFTPVAGLVAAPRTKNIGFLAGGVFDVMVTNRLGVDIIGFGEVERDPWLAQSRGNGLTYYGAAGLGTTILASEHIALSPSLVRIWNLEREPPYGPSWSPGLLVSIIR